MLRSEDIAFDATIEGTEKGRVYIVLPFNAAEVWGERDRYHVSGMLDGRPFRGVAEAFGGGHLVSLGPAFRRDRGLGPGDKVSVVLSIEGAQRDELAPDIAAALDDEPEAASFYDSLAPFYRTGYLRWINATKRSPETRAARIAEFVELLRRGQKQR